VLASRYAVARNHNKQQTNTAMKQKILLVLSILFGLVFINSGLNKFFNYMPAPENMPEEAMKLMGAAMDFGWLIPLVGVVEILGGLLFISNKYRALGAIIIFPVMIGIVLISLVNIPSTRPISLVLLAINLWVLYENREKLAPLFRR